ncbi:hypothetical protein [Embleya sp. NPDC050493]|uniref:hypothetical protein n=1 Tax=Embleya sp. NPDC050493 TaxID=3363989 RepID=UPI0037A2A0DF
MPQSAEVLVRTEALAEPPAPAWAEQAAAELPGLNVVVAALDEGRHLVRLRDGSLWEACAVRTWGTNRPWLDPVVLGSAVHLWLAGGGDTSALHRGIRVRTSDREVHVAFTEGSPEWSAPWRRARH